MTLFVCATNYTAVRGTYKQSHIMHIHIDIALCVYTKSYHIYTYRYI